MTARRLTAPHAATGEVSAAYIPENRLRVQQILSEAMFDEFFPLADDFYTYQMFLEAVEAFPAFCNEVNLNYAGHKINAADKDQACKRELATLFAHIAYTTGLKDAWNSTPLFK